MTTPPIVVALPGASLLKLTLLTRDRLRVECPGCGAVEVFSPGTGAITHRSFRHATDDCPTLAAIDRAALLAHPTRGGLQ